MLATKATGTITPGRSAEQDEVDRILDKIRRSGYDSLTDEEKKRLFENSNR